MYNNPLPALQKGTYPMMWDNKDPSTFVPLTTSLNYLPSASKNLGANSPFINQFPPAHIPQAPVIFQTTPAGGQEMLVLPSNSTGLRMESVQPLGTVVTTSFNPLSHSANNDIIISRSYAQNNAERVPLINKKSSTQKFNFRPLILGLLLAFIFLASAGGIIFIFRKLKNDVTEKNIKRRSRYNLITNTTTVVTQSWNPNITYPGVYVARYPLSVLENFVVNNPKRLSTSLAYVKLFYSGSVQKQISRKAFTQALSNPYNSILYTYASNRNLPLVPNGTNKPSIERNDFLVPLVTTEAIYSTATTPMPFKTIHVDITNKEHSRNTSHASSLAVN